MQDAPPNRNTRVPPCAEQVLVPVQSVVLQPFPKQPNCQPLVSPSARSKASENRDWFVMGPAGIPVRWTVLESSAPLRLLAARTT